MKIVDQREKILGLSWSKAGIYEWYEKIGIRGNSVVNIDKDYDRN